MTRWSLLAAAALCIALVAIVLDRQLDEAVEAEPAWLVVRIENGSDNAVSVVGLTVTHASPQGAEPGWPRVIDASPSPGFATARHRLEGKRAEVELRLQRAGASALERHTVTVEARQGGICSVTIDIVRDGMRSDACSDWTPTYGGHPH
jgi:hypothetical protein